MDALVGNVVRLEPLDARHSEGLFTALGNDEEAWRWMITPAPQHLSEMQLIVDAYIDERTKGTREPFAVIELASGKVIGTSSFMDISKKDRSLEIGATIYSREFWRTRVNTETKLLMLTRAFEVKNCVRVALKTDHLNIRSQTAILRIGARFDGRLRSHRIRTDGSFRDSMYYSILESEWPEVKANLEAMLG